MTKFCTVCGKPFEPKSYAYHQKYCSKDCAYVQIKLNNKKNRARGFDIGHITGKMKRPDGSACLTCGKPFVQHFPNEKFCSDSCRLDFFSISDIENLFDFIRG